MFYGSFSSNNVKINWRHTNTAHFKYLKFQLFRQRKHSQRCLKKYCENHTKFIIRFGLGLDKTAAPRLRRVKAINSFRRLYSKRWQLKESGQQLVNGQFFTCRPETSEHRRKIERHRSRERRNTFGKGSTLFCECLAENGRSYINRIQFSPGVCLTMITRTIICRRRVPNRVGFEPLYARGHHDSPRGDASCGSTRKSAAPLIGLRDSTSGQIQTEYHVLLFHNINLYVYRPRQKSDTVDHIQHIN